MTVENALRGRWRFKNANLTAAKAAFERALSLNEKIKQKANEIGRDDKLTPVGRNDAMRQYLAGNEIAPNLRHIQGSVALMRSGLDAWKAQIRQRKAPDKTDLAGAILRDRLRETLRNMPRGEQARLLLASDADPRLLDAVFEGPDYLSGLTPDIRARVETAMIERERPGDLAAINDAEEAFTLVNAASSVALETTRAAGGFQRDTDVHDFIAASISAQHASAIAAHVQVDWHGFGPSTG